ncbi:hypothetical protein MesoLj113b_20190 [Mesorhizobium sp. 113-3-3]|nr:hypothetical protein MesoLj113b_20190 [Mesorhizobium sp. 113-3-3]
MINEKTDRFEIKSYERDPRFTYVNRFDIFAGESDVFDTLLVYRSYDQLIIPSAVPIQEFLDVLNKLRQRILSGLTAGRYQSIGSSGETGRIIVASQRSEFDSKTIELGWKKMLYSADLQSDRGPADSAEVILKIGSLSGIAQEEISFLRVYNEYIDFSFEFDCAVVTVRPELRHELMYAHERLSRYDTERVFFALQNKHGYAF